MEIREILKKIVGNSEVYAKMCKVDDVDTSKLTCDVSPSDGTAPMLGVRLTPLAGNAAFTPIPVKGSWVLVVMLNSNDGIVAMVDRAENFIMKNSSLNFKDLLLNMAAIIKALTVSTPAGPSGTPLPPTIQAVVQFENDVKTLFK